MITNDFLDLLRDGELNENCKRCNSKERLELLKEPYCNEAKSVVDNLPLRCVGEWAKKKQTIVGKYFHMFGNAMKKYNIHYIEICSGPGTNINKDSGREFLGNPLFLQKLPTINNFKSITFIDNSVDIVNALDTRIKSKEKNNIVVSHGDYNDVQSIDKSLTHIDGNNLLVLIYIDPTDCSVPLSTINYLSNKFPKCDVIINVFTYYDFGRQIGNIFENDKDYSKVIKKYDAFIGRSGFIDELRKFNKKKKLDKKEVRNIFREEYKKSLKNIGFNYVAEQPTKVEFYELFFASKHEMGLKFWKESNKINPSGLQKIFVFL